MQRFHGRGRDLPASRHRRGGWLGGSIGIFTVMGSLVLHSAAAAGLSQERSPQAFASSPPIVVIVMENTSYSRIVGSANAPFINGTMIAGGLSFTNYFDNTDGSLHNYFAMTDGDIATSHAPSLENIFHQLQNSGTSWATYEESMPSACYAGTDFGTVPGATDGLYVKIHNPAIYFNNINDNASVCNAHVLPLTTSTFNPQALPMFSYVVPNNCNNMHTQSKNGTMNASCPAYFGTNGAADKIKMADSWLATFVPAVASNAIVVLTWDEGSFISPQQIVTVEYGLGVARATNNTSFNHFNLLAGLETHFGVPLINGAVGKAPLPIGSSSPSSPTITSFTPTSGPAGTVVTILGTNFTASAVVKFNGSTGTGFVFVSPTEVRAAVPAAATTGPISVTTDSGTGTSATNFTVPSGSPTISSFSPASGPVGTTVTIGGTNFTGATVVKFNGVLAAFTVNSPTQITATVPPGATTGKIIVKTPAGKATSLTKFTVT
jgi:IPT/TIG domain/Phosphoesterase family